VWAVIRVFQSLDPGIFQAHPCCWQQRHSSNGTFRRSYLVVPKPKASCAECSADRIPPH
jgi:hypothetical protein